MVPCDNDAFEFVNAKSRLVVAFHVSEHKFSGCFVSKNNWEAVEEEAQFSRATPSVLVEQ